MSDGLRVQLTSEEELREQLLARRHWFVAFGRSSTDAIDALDKALGVEPTFPTLMFPLCITIIPKDRIPRARFQRAIQKAVNKQAVVGPDQDVVVVAEPDEAPAIFMFLSTLVDGAQPA